MRKQLLTHHRRHVAVLVSVEASLVGGIESLRLIEGTNEGRAGKPESEGIK